MSCIATVEGFFVSGEYVAKELTILFSVTDYQHFMFDCPVSLILSPRDQCTTRYAQNLNGLVLSDNCFLPYNIIGYILSKIQNYRIYTAGNQAKGLLTSYLPKTEVIDICQMYNFKYPLDLQDTPCFVRHPSRYCSLSKAFTLKTAIQILQIDQSR